MVSNFFIEFYKLVSNSENVIFAMSATIVILGVIVVIYPHIYITYSQRYPQLKKLLNLAIFISKKKILSNTGKKYKRYQEKKYMFSNTIEFLRNGTSFGQDLPFACSYYVLPDIKLKKNSNGAQQTEYHKRKRQGDFEGVSSNSLIDLTKHLEKDRAQINLSGFPGYGKSNLCRYVCNFYTHIEKSIFEEVFLIDTNNISKLLRDFDGLNSNDKATLDSSKYLLPFLILNSSSFLEEGSLIWISKKLETKCLIVVDGLDEFDNISKRDEFLSALYAGINGKNISTLIAGRPTSFERVKIFGTNRLKTFAIQPFSETQIIELAKNIYDLNNQCLSNTFRQTNEITMFKVTDFMQRISGATMELASNPFLLTLMVYLDLIGNKKLPSSKPELIQMFIRESISRRSDNLITMMKEVKPDLNIIIQGDNGITNNKLTEILANLSFLIHNENAKKTILSELSKELGLTQSEKAYIPNKLIEFYTDIGVLRTKGTVGLRFVHRCFGEYLYARHLLTIYNPNTSAGKILQKATNQQFSEVLYYLCWHQGKIDSFVIELMFVKPANLESSIPLLAYEKASPRIVISDKLKNKIVSIKNELAQCDAPEANRMALQEKLMILEVADPFSKHPLSCKEAATIFRLRDEYQCRRNCLVGLSPKEINILIKRINEEYSNGNGSFYIPKMVYNSDKISYDTIITDGDGYLIALQHSKRFKKTKDFISEYSIKFLKNRMPNAKKNFNGIPLIRSLKCITNGIMAMWTPNILLTNKMDVYEKQLNMDYGDYSKEQYDKIKSRYFGTAAQRANYIRNQSVSEVMFGKFQAKKIMLADEEIIDFFELLDYERYSKNFIEKQIQTNLLNLFKALIYGTNYKLFEKTQLALCRLLTINAIFNRKISAWGKIRLAYSHN